MPLNQPKFIVGDWSHIFEGEKSDRPTRIVIDVHANKLIQLEILADRDISDSYRLPTRLEFEDVADSIFHSNSELIDCPTDYGLVPTDSLPEWAPYTSFIHDDDLWSFDGDELAIWEEEEGEFHYHANHGLSEPTVESMIRFIEQIRHKP
jgi:hypothetical protein